MSQTSEISASAYTQEMETLGALPNIPTFDGEPVPVSRNPLTLGTRPLQLLPLPGTEFPVRYETSQMRGFHSEVDLGKAHSGGSATDASAFWDLLDLPMRARVMTLMPVDYAAITGLRFTGPVPPLDARYQTATLGGQLVRSLLDVTTQTRYTAQGCVSYEVVYRFWAERIRTRLATWRELPVEARPAAPAYTREERDQAAWSFLFYIISSQLLCTSQNKGDQAVLACLRDLSQVGSFDWATLALAHLYHGLDVWTRGSGESNWLFIRPLEVWAYEYCIYPGGPSGDAPAESRRIPRYLAHCHHTYASGEEPEYWRSFLNDRELSDLFLTPWDCDAWRTYPGREVAQLHTRSRFLMRGYWADRYFLGERVYDTLVSPAQRRVPHAPPRHMCLLEGLPREDLEARLPEILEYTQERKTHKTAAHYRAEVAAKAGVAVAPVGPAGVVLGDVPFPLGMEVVLDPSLDLGSGIIIPADLRQAPPPVQLDPKHTTHVPAQRYQELCQRFRFAGSFIGRLYSERHERAEVERLQTRLEVEGIPLDSSDEDDDDSSEDASPSPPPQAAASPSRRRR
ncbi:hypothetical protein JCGZ_15363 [Jatropha curcas]|uniref:Aminotransferase-like plant mobile domain-containing protein n=1 Tax=Jatropha curcas TaxID=180498 RepID=A0A067KII4_JATCU|nr:hypothetical protein JCGZ_15363 [Jatropha curcas]